MHNTIISTMITEKWKKPKKKTDRNCWCAWALYNVFSENGKATIQNFTEPCNT